MARGYSADSYWRNRAEFVQGQPAIKRKYRWDRSGPRPIDHPSLSELGL